MIKRKTYSKEFKLDAIALVRDQNDCISEAARNLEVFVAGSKKLKRMMATLLEEMAN